MQSANVVEPAIIGLADERVDRSNLLVSWLVQRPAHNSFQRCSNAKRIGQRDRCFNRAEFIDLRRTGELAECVAHIDGPGHLLLKDIAGMRNDYRDPGPNVIARYEGRMSHADAGHIRDGVEWSRGKHPRRETDVARARTRRLRRDRSDTQHRDEHRT